MLARVLFVLLAGVPACRGPMGAKGDFYSEYYDAEYEGVKNKALYDNYNDEIRFPEAMTSIVEEPNPKEIIDMKEVLNKILQGKKPASLRERRTARDYTDSDFLENSINGLLKSSTEQELAPVIKNWQPTVEVQKWSPTVDEQEYLDVSSRQAAEQDGSFVYQTESSTYDKNIVSSSYIDYGAQDVQTWSSTEETEKTEDTLMYPLEYGTTYNNMLADVNKLVQKWRSSSSHEASSYDNAAMRADVRQLIQNWSPSGNVQHRGPSMAKGEMNQQNTGMQTEASKLDPWHQNLDHKHWSAPDYVQHQNTSMNVQHWSHAIKVEQWNPIKTDNQNDLMQESTTTTYNSDMQAEMQESTTMYNNSEMQDKMNQQNTGIQHCSPRANDQHQSLLSTVKHVDSEDDLQLRERRVGEMDINAIMDIISNLTYDYEWNLTGEFNKTIQQFGVPTCPWETWGPNGIWTTSTTTGTTLFPWDFENTSVVSKCFVCGLETREIPRNAHCADAFAGDFLPLMPIDARSRGKIAGFRKYCRYIDAQNYIENPEEPRAIYGRFTGGCAVRWTDLTGVYTQRTCRSKFRPLMGKHLASKRMAKLELALVNVENGCIISPMATLLPVSRGISLYARFHACVCSTNWCNRATLEQASFVTLVTIVLAYWLVHYP